MLLGSCLRILLAPEVHVRMLVLFGSHPRGQACPLDSIASTNYKWDYYKWCLQKLRLTALFHFLREPFMQRAILSISLFLSMISGQATRAALPLRTETFDTNPSWMSIGSGSNGNLFGFQPQSTFAGGGAGEAGGTFTRSDFNRVYADTNLGGFIDLDQPFEAHGKFDFIAKNRPDFGQPMWLGHFGLEDGNFGAGNKVGLFFNNGASQADLSWGLGIKMIGVSDAQTSQSVIAPNIHREWSYSWDPIGGDFGMGRLTGSLSGPGGGTRTVDLSPEQRAFGVHFDAFGFAGHFPSGPNPNPTFLATMFIDDVAYSVAIPEPASMTFVLASMATLMVPLVRRRLGDTR
jgi:hypothetical protein